MNKKIFIPILLVVAIIIIAVILNTQKTEPISPDLILNEDSNKISEDVVDENGGGDLMIDKPDLGSEVVTNDIDISDWQTYRNEELGFELRLPEQWTVEERYSVRLFSEGGPVGDVVSLFSSEVNIYGDPFVLHIYRITNTAQKLIIDFFDEAHSGDRVVRASEQQVFLGEENLEFTYIISGSYRAYIKFIGDDYLEINFHDPKVPYLTKLVNQVLETLK